jgi:hypothetical protein
MKEFPFWVIRVNHMNRVSSAQKPAIFLGLFLVVLIFIFSYASSSVASDITSRKVIDLANVDRKEKGIGELAENEKLAAAAEAKAGDMAAKRYFAHTSPEGKTPWHWIENEKYEYSYAGENLAMDFVSAEKMNEAWLASPTHRANILNEKFKDVGVAVKEGVVDGHLTFIVVQMFGSGDKSAPVEKKEVVDGDIFPNLPMEKIDGINSGNEKTRRKMSSFPSPMITSPQKGEVISKNETEIFGRANPGSKVDCFDNGKLFASLVADESGWFKAKAPDLSEGKHFLEAKPAGGSGHAIVNSTGSGITFFVEARKPRIRYQLAAGKSEDEFVLDIFVDKADAVISVENKKYFSGSGKFVCALERKNKLSVSLAVEDRGGNKAFREVDLSGYYLRPHGFDATRKISAMLVPEKVFAAERGMEAVRKNMGLAMVE